MWFGKLTALDMTLLGSLGRKISTQTKLIKPNPLSISKFLEFFALLFNHVPVSTRWLVPIVSREIDDLSGVANYFWHNLFSHLFQFEYAQQIKGKHLGMAVMLLTRGGGLNLNATIIITIV